MDTNSKINEAHQKWFQNLNVEEYAESEAASVPCERLVNSGICDYKQNCTFSHDPAVFFKEGKYNKRLIIQNEKFLLWALKYGRDEHSDKGKKNRTEDVFKLACDYIMTKPKHHYRNRVESFRKEELKIRERARQEQTACKLIDEFASLTIRLSENCYGLKSGIHNQLNELLNKQLPDLVNIHPEGVSLPNIEAARINACDLVKRIQKAAEEGGRKSCTTLDDADLPTLSVELNNLQSRCREEKLDEMSDMYERRDRVWDEARKAKRNLDYVSECCERLRIKDEHKDSSCSTDTEMLLYDVVQSIRERFTVAGATADFVVAISEYGSNMMASISSKRADTAVEGDIDFFADSVRCLRLIHSLFDFLIAVKVIEVVLTEQSTIAGAGSTEVLKPNDAAQNYLSLSKRTGKAKNKKLNKAEKEIVTFLELLTDFGGIGRLPPNPLDSLSPAAGLAATATATADITAPDKISVPIFVDHEKAAEHENFTAASQHLAVSIDADDPSSDHFDIDERSLTDAERGHLRWNRAKSVLSEYVVPIVLDAFHRIWVDSGNKCPCSSAPHDFKEITPNCLIVIMTETWTDGRYDFRAATQTARNITRSQLSNDGFVQRKVFEQNFDLHALCDVVSSWMQWQNGVGSSSILKSDDVVQLKSLRGLVDHTNVHLDEASYNRITKGDNSAVAIGVRIIKSLNLREDARTRLASILSRCKKAYSGIDLDKKLLEHARKDAQKQVHGAKQGLAAILQLHPSFQDTAPMSKYLVDRLTQKTSSKFLILPRIEKEEKVKVVESLHFLTKVPWVAVLDLAFDPKTNNKPPLFEGMLKKFSLNVVFELPVFAQEFSHQFGQKSTLYTGSIDVFNQLVDGRMKSSINSEDLVIILAGPNGYSTDKVATMKLGRAIAEKPYFLPFSEDQNFLSFVHQQIFYEDEDENNSETILEQKRFKANICSIDHVATLIYSYFRTPTELLLRANISTRGAFCGFSVSALKGHEVLHFGCDEIPPNVPKEAVHDPSDPQYNEKSTVDAELRHFLSGNVASWYLLSHGRVVKRSLLKDLASLIDQYDAITIHCHFAAGVTTLCRDFLYSMKDRYTCFIIQSPFHRDELAVVLGKLYRAADLALLVLVDLKDPMQSEVIVSDLLAHQKKNEFSAKILCTTSTRLPAGDDSSVGDNRMKRVEFGGELDGKEMEHFRRLSDNLKMKRKIFYQDRDLSDMVLSSGMVNIEKIFKEGSLHADLRKQKYPTLLDWGFYPEEILLLFAGESRAASRLAESRLPLLGLMPFNDAYRENVVRPKVQQLVNTITLESSNEKNLLKLCVFVAMFSPSVFIDARFARALVLHNVDISPNSAQLIVANDGQLSVRTYPLAKMLSSLIFGKFSNHKYEHIHQYLQEDLFSQLNANEDSFRALVRVLLNALCEFQMWHVSQPPAHISEKLRYPFLVEMLLCYDDGFEKAKDFFNSVLSTSKKYVNVEDKDDIEITTSFASQLARLICDEAFRQRCSTAFNATAALLVEAEDLLKSQSSVYRVHDRFGNLYKTKLRLLQHYESCGTKISEIGNDAVVDLTRSAQEHFEKAMRLSNWAVPHPIMGLAQTLETALDVLFQRSSCDGKPENRKRIFIEQLHKSGLRVPLTLESEQSKQYSAALLNECWLYLQEAKQTVSVKSQPAQPSSMAHSFVDRASIRSGTLGKINQCMRSLADYSPAVPQNSSVMSKKQLDIPLAVSLLLNNQLSSCENVCYCLLTFAKHWNETDSAYIHLENMFLTACKLSCFATDSIEFTLSRIAANVRVDLQSYLNSVLEATAFRNWVDAANNYRNRSLISTLALIALLLCRQIYYGMRFDDLKDLLNSLRMRFKDESVKHSTLKLFFSKQLAHNGVPFSGLICGENLPFADKIRNAGKINTSAIQAQEKVYLNEGGDVLKCFHGTCGVLGEGSEKRPYVYCIEFDENILCNNFEPFGISKGDEVDFFLRLSEQGLFAHGLQKSDASTTSTGKYGNT